MLIGSVLRKQTDLFPGNEEERLTTSIKVSNLTNAEVQQHVFGDIIKRLVVGELHLRF
jgi:hypothetical protein